MKVTFSKFSQNKSTFINEQEEADLMNINEFSENEKSIKSKFAHIDSLNKEERVFKMLPISKESFLNWHK